MQKTKFDAIKKTIKNNLWWIHATRDLGQIPLFLVPRFIEANDFFGIGMITYAENGLITGYKTKDTARSFSKRHNVDFKGTALLLKQFVRFLEDGINKDYNDPDLASKTLCELDNWLGRYAGPHLSLQLWGLDTSISSKERASAIKRYKKEIDSVRSYPVFKKMKLLLKKILDDTDLSQEKKDIALKFTTPEELMQIVKNKKFSESIKKTISKRENKFLLWYDGQKHYETTDAVKIETILDMLNENLDTEFKAEKLNKFVGKSSFKGEISGKVRLVRKLSELKEVKKGEILVSNMITPEYTVILDKVAAIIVDEEGFLSHIHTLVKEFKKPFISDTKIATRMLKTGQKIEIKNNQIRLL